VIGLPDLIAMQDCASRVKVDDSLIAYLLALVEETRQHEALELGASTRGALGLQRAAQARALLDGRDYCVPEDLAELAVDVLAHRVMPSLHGGLHRGPEETAWILREILDRVPVPL
jgi:MoxR-like ATPase